MKTIHLTGQRRLPFFLRSEMDRLLCLSMLFSCVLVGTRIFYTGRGSFLMLIWNLFLAYIPYFITEVLSRNPALVKNRISFAALFAGWLLFVPNSFYIITDLFHLTDRLNDGMAPLWFDLAMIYSFSWNGLLLGVLSVRAMERILVPRPTLKNELLFLLPVMLLNAFGIYIGRYLRYNSWDIVTNPFQLMRDMIYLVFHPIRNQPVWFMVFSYSMLMTLMYLMLKKLSKALYR